MHHNTPLHYEGVSGAGWDQLLMDAHLSQLPQLCIINDMVGFRAHQVGSVALGVHHELRITKGDDDLVNIKGTRQDNYATPLLLESHDLLYY